MLFNSIEFLLFLPAVFLLYWLFFNKKLILQNLLMLCASYFFYGWWSWKFLLLLILSTLLDYVYGFYVASENRKKARLFLWLSIINNLGILAIFKYYNFFITEFQKTSELVGIHFTPVLIQVAIPVGISFYTFHGMSYVFDIYRRAVKPVRNFIDYALFVSFFPLLVAGPIERANHLLPQIQTKRNFNYQQAVSGCKLILWGMFKKVVIADSLATIAETVFGRYNSFSAYTLIIAAIGLSFQIYCDFSGYSDIAIGTAKLFGFEIFSNFRFPYFSRDIAEFWRRWHISLSSWFRDYVYIPLGGSRNGKLKTIKNIFVVFILSGIWHGAGWNFIVWAGIHACGYLPLLLLKKNRRNIDVVVAFDKKLPDAKQLLQMISTFAFVTFAWIFFRIHDLGTCFDYLKHILISSLSDPKQYFSIPKGATVFLYILPVVITDWYWRRNERVLKTPDIPRWIIWCLYVLIFILVILNIGEKKEFIYFRF